MLLALISPSHTLRHRLTKRSTLSAFPILNEVGENSRSPNESAEWKKRCTLINATNLLAGTTKWQCRFSPFTPRTILMTKKDLPRLSWMPRWALSLWIYAVLSSQPNAT